MRKTRAKTPAGVLRAAARVIRERGWTQREYEDHETGAVCLWGAINLAVAGDAIGSLEDFPDDLYADVTDTLELRTGNSWAGEWNDAPERTVEEVLAVLEGRPA